MMLKFPGRILNRNKTISNRLVVVNQSQAAGAQLSRAAKS